MSDMLNKGFGFEADPDLGEEISMLLSTHGYINTGFVQDGVAHISCSWETGSKSDPVFETQENRDKLRTALAQLGITI